MRSSRGGGSRTTPSRFVARALPFALATGVFFAAMAVGQHEVWRAGIAHHVPVYPSGTTNDSPVQAQWILLGRVDAQWVSTLVARHARTLVSAPQRIYDVEPCFPAERAINLGEPMLTMGLLGAPFALVTDEPLVIYNLTVVCMTLATALAMFLLVWRWTGVPAAGIAAGVVFAFMPFKTQDIVHPYIRDTLWTVLALYFARVYFERGRLRDIVLAALCAGLQMGASLYPFVASALLALPFLAWLVYSHGIERVRPWHVAIGVLVVAGATYFVFGPYLDTAGSRGTRVGSLRQFVGWRLFWPNGQMYAGFVLPALALTGMLAPRRAAMPGEHDPRPALVVGALACMVLAMGPVSPLGNVYDALGHLVPGLAMVRAPGQIASGLQLVFSVLVGFGVAALVRVSPIRWRLAAGAALVAVGTAGTLMIGYRGSEAPIVYSAHLARPAEEGLAFHRELAALGGTGPILDLPLDTPELTYGPTPPITLAAHHGRRTTTCHGSYPSDQADEIHRLARQLDRRTSTRRLAAMGVTTIVVQLPTQPDEAARVQREILDRADANPAGLVPLLARGRFHAYRLRTDDGPLARP